MALFEVIIGFARKIFQETDEEIARRRAEIAEEVGNERVQNARRQQLASTRLSSTPFPEAIQRLGQNVERLRKRAYESAEAAMTDLLALELAEKSREAMLEAEARHRRENDHKGHPATYPEWEAFVDQLFARGVTRHKLRQLSELEVAIIADLIRWKVEDAKHTDPNSPWQALLEEYCNRKLEIPRDSRSSIDLSVPGPPPKPKDYPPYYWQRDRIFRFHHELQDHRRSSEVDASNETTQGPAGSEYDDNPPRMDGIEQEEFAPRVELDESDSKKPVEERTEADGASGLAASTVSETIPDVEMTFSKAMELASALLNRSRELRAKEWAKVGITPDLERDGEALDGVQAILAIEPGNSAALKFYENLKNHGLTHAKFEYRYDLFSKLTEKIQRLDQEVIGELQKIGLL